MAISRFSVLKIPDFEKIVDMSGFLSARWRDFFQLMIDIISPLGVEKYFEIANNQFEAANVTGLKVNSLKTSQAIVDYLIQRITTGTNPVELLESGTFHLVYRPTDEAWVKLAYGSPGPDTSGVTLTVTADGQVQYTSTLVDGTASISKLIYRMRTLSGKNTQQSSAG
jgi:hypothetical protein